MTTFIYPNRKLKVWFWIWILTAEDHLVHFDALILLLQLPIQWGSPMAS
jgi:hypothetical protein